MDEILTQLLALVERAEHRGFTDASRIDGEDVIGVEFGGELFFISVSPA
jgi:hypothetical protein